MSPVSTTSDPTVGYTSKRTNGPGFDPIAARNTDRPKFRLDDYKGADESRRAEPRRAEPARSERARSESDHKTDKARDDQSVNEEAVARTKTSGKADTGKTDTSKGEAHAELSPPVPATQADSARRDHKSGGRAQ